MGYVPPSRTHVSDTLFWEEASRVLSKMMKDLSKQNNLTLAVDGWTDNGKSLYAYTIVTLDRKVYLHSLKDFSAEKHTATYLTEETCKVIECVGSARFAAFVTDNAVNMKKLRENIVEKYPNIISLRCIPHFVNLVTQDIMKHEWARTVLKKCQSLVSFFGRHPRQKALLAGQRKEGTNELKSFVATRWYSSGYCIKSVLDNENALKLLMADPLAELPANISSTVANRQFWADAELLVKLLNPVMTIIGKLESKTAAIADCYRQLIVLGACIHVGSENGPASFHRHCLDVFAARWQQLNEKLYLLAYFLHPLMRQQGRVKIMLL